MTDKNKEAAELIAQRVGESGGSAYYVGGYVRDRLRGVENKDIDVEVHGIAPKKLEEILDSVGRRIAVGESFGVYNLKGYSLDIAMPRRENCRGKGHRDFDISVDPFIGTRKAAMRRDFTVNALMEDVLTHEITDHFGGIDDLKAGILRRVSDDSFPEDPLRVLRAAQFAARFGYSVEPETVELCRGMDLSALPKERVMGELEKALLKAPRPSVFFEVLRTMDQLGTWFCELEKTVGVEQERAFHGEGDVWTHTVMVLDAAAEYRDRVGDPLGFMLSAVTHDLGKAICTVTENGRIRSPGHDAAGVPLAESFVSRLTAQKSLIKYAANMTLLHMLPNMLASEGASVKATNRLFDRSDDPEGLIALSVCDDTGRICSYKTGGAEGFLRERLSVYREYMSRPYVMGKDLIAAGLTPTERFSEYLELSHKLRLAGVSKSEALSQILGEARKNGDLVPRRN